MLTGWCNPAHAELDNWAHRRCNGGSSANPDREWVSCPCACHADELEDLLGVALPARTAADDLADLL